MESQETIVKNTGLLAVGDAVPGHFNGLRSDR